MHTIRRPLTREPSMMERTSDVSHTTRAKYQRIEAMAQSSTQIAAALATIGQMRSGSAERHSRCHAANEAAIATIRNAKSGSFSGCNDHRMADGVSASAVKGRSTGAAISPVAANDQRRRISAAARKQAMFNRIETDGTAPKRSVHRDRIWMKNTDGAALLKKMTARSP